MDYETSIDAGTQLRLLANSLHNLSRDIRASAGSQVNYGSADRWASALTALAKDIERAIHPADAYSNEQR